MIMTIPCRKTTECLIGILKARFWILKNPLRLHHKEDITNVVWVCAVLHNMLLHFDGFDKLWTAEDWLTQDPVDTDDEESNTAKMRRLIPPERLQEYLLPTDESDETKTQVESKHFVLRAALIANLRHLWDKNEVEHLRYPKVNK